MAYNGSAMRSAGFQGTSISVYRKVCLMKALQNLHLLRELNMAKLS